jgi:raffinose/stachyose/melibiose transport system permease protein
VKAGNDMNNKVQKRILLFTFLFFPMLLMVAFLVYPTTRLFYMSFTNWDGVLPNKEFVGLDNYKLVFSDSEVFLSLRNNIVYLVTGLVQNFVAIIIAVILVSKIKGTNFFRALIFMPYIINSVAVAFMFNFMYDFTRSPINIILQNIGLTPVDFIGNTKYVNISLAAISFWRYLGLNMVIYIAALQSVPREIYEAADIDGANSIQVLRLITLPSIKRIIELNLFLSLSGSLQAFIEALIITKGGPGSASRTFVYTIVKNAFEANNFSFAAALAVVLIIMTLIITGIQRKFVLRGE